MTDDIQYRRHHEKIISDDRRRLDEAEEANTRVAEAEQWEQPDDDFEGCSTEQEFDDRAEDLMAKDLAERAGK